MKNLTYAMFCITFWTIVLMILSVAIAESFYHLYTF